HDEPAGGHDRSPGINDRVAGLTRAALDVHKRETLFPGKAKIAECRLAANLCSLATLGQLGISNLVRGPVSNRIQLPVAQVRMRIKKHRRRRNCRAHEVADTVFTAVCRAPNNMLKNFAVVSVAAAAIPNVIMAPIKPVPLR